VGTLIRVFDPISSYKIGIERGRFKLSSFSFDAYVWQKDISKYNPVIDILGLSRSSKLDIPFNKEIRKTCFYSTVMLSILAINIFSNETSFIALIVSMSTIALAYLVGVNYSTELFFCLRAGFQKER